LIFGRIDYINLLPFHIFMKRYIQSTQISQIMRYKRAVPSKINSDFANRRVDAAFISSIVAKKRRYIPLGIVAKKSVRSVLIVDNEGYQPDKASATSNALAKILYQNGRVLIGDEALKYFHSGKEHIDLAKLWNEKYNLPFVFALLCFHNHKNQLIKIKKEFLKSKTRIPRYLLDRASEKSSIKTEDIIEYLALISYDIDNRAALGLKKFWRLAKNIK